MKPQGKGLKRGRDTEERRKDKPIQDIDGRRKMK